MANYFVINNKFRPYSFDELIKPYQMYGEAYKEQEAALSKLENEAAVLGSALSQTNDPTAYNTYSQYLQQVQQAADDIASNGLNTATRRRASSLTTAYNKNIVPIQAAYNRRKELQDEQRKAMLADDTKMFQRNFNLINKDSSLDRFIENPNYDYGEVVSGKGLTEQVSQAASNLAKTLSDYGPGKKLDAYTNTFLQQHGYTPEQVYDAISNPDRATSQPILNSIVESVVASSGVADWDDPSALANAYDYARRGLWSSVGQSSVSTYDNYGARLAAQKAASGLNDSTLKGLAINPVNIYSRNELTDIQKAAANYSEYFDRQLDGTYKLNEKGRKAYEEPVYRGGYIEPSITGVRSWNQGTPTPSDFRKFMDDLGVENINDVEKAWSTVADSKWDATKTTEYDYSYANTEQPELKQTVISAARGTELEEVDYDRKTNSWVPTGRTIPLEEFAKSEYTVPSSRMSHNGTQLLVQNNKNGETIRVRMPREINPTAEEARDNALNNAVFIREAITTGYLTLPDGTKRAIPEKDLPEYYKAYNEALQSAYLYQSQLGVKNTVQNQVFNPYVF